MSSEWPCAGFRSGHQMDLEMAFWEAGFDHGLSAGQVEERIFVQAAGCKQQYLQLLGKVLLLKVLSQECYLFHLI